MWSIDGVLLTHKKKWSSNPCYNMAELWKIMLSEELRVKTCSIINSSNAYIDKTHWYQSIHALIPHFHISWACTPETMCFKIFSPTYCFILSFWSNFRLKSLITVNQLYFNKINIFKNILKCITSPQIFRSKF